MDGDLKDRSQESWRRDPTPGSSPDLNRPADPTSDLGRRVHELEYQFATLKAALVSRDTIGMAKGILMAREGCTPEEAFDMLKRASQRENRKLAEIAAELVASNAERATTNGQRADRLP